MRKFVLAGIAVAMMATPAFAANYRFVIVPKAMNNPFFDFARDGCLKRAKELGNIECIYKGPVEHEPATQAQIIQDFVTQKVDGLAISVAGFIIYARVILLVIGIIMHVMAAARRRRIDEQLPLPRPP